jgi:hypothetical protein
MRWEDLCERERRTARRLPGKQRQLPDGEQHHESPEGAGEQEARLYDQEADLRAGKH